MSDLNIQYNVNVIKKVKGLNFQADQISSVLFILFALYENKIDLLDEFDDYNKQRKALLLYKELEVRKLVAPNEEKEGSHYNLTELGVSLVEDIRNEYGVTTERIAMLGKEALPEAITAPTDDISTWIEEWVDIFPRGVKSGGKLVRGDKVSCERKMKVFMREYSYDKDTIMRATQAYVNSKAMENYAFMTCAVYFIYRMDVINRDKVSDLASWCDQMIHEKEKGESENNLEIMA